MSPSTIATPPVTAAPPPPAPFEPTFEKVVMRWSMNPPPGIDPFSVEQNTINDRTYATEETAVELQKKFGAIGIILAPQFINITAGYFLSDFRTPARERQLVFQQGTVLKNDDGAPALTTKRLFVFSAGLLGDEYRRNPEAKHPGLSYVTGIPPVTVNLLSLPEQCCWRLLRAAYFDAVLAAGIQL